MSTILVVTASPRGERSVSRALATAFVELWSERHPEDRILLRDVGHHPVPHVTEPWIAGAFAPAHDQPPEATAAIAVSDSLVEEFLSADRYIFGVPMHNFSVPSTFKAYIDQLVRPGKTFGVGPTGYEGLVTGKKALVITTSGGAYRLGSARADLNFLEPYLRGVFGFMGVTEVQFVTADNQNQGESTARQTRDQAEAALRELAETW